jgi:hypothetical protein
MKLGGFLLAKAVVSVVFGLAFVVLPSQVGSLLGIGLDPAGQTLARMVGACLIGIGFICWLGRDFESQARQGVAFSLCVADSIGFVVVLLAQINGLMNVLGWIIVCLWLLFAMGLGYFRFLAVPES